MEVLNWPAHSPDLNQIENIWGALARVVYHKGRKYNPLEELKNIVLMNWHLITNDMIVHHVDSMPPFSKSVIHADRKHSLLGSLTLMLMNKCFKHYNFST